MDLSDCLNLGTGFDHNGRTFTARELTLLEKARFAQWMRDKALAAVTSGAAADAPESVRQSLYTHYLDQCSTGAYDYGSPNTARALNTVSGQAYLLYLCNLDRYPDLTPAEAETALLSAYAVVAQKLVDSNTPKSAAPAASAGATYSRCSEPDTTSPQKPSDGSPRAKSSSPTSHPATRKGKSKSKDGTRPKKPR